MDRTPPLLALLLNRIMRLCALLALGLGLAACAAPQGGVPVDDRGRGGSAAARAADAGPGGSYVVQRGDTLYQIAFRYGMDWRALATHNRIAAPYTIYPGQRLQLGTGPVAAVASRPAPTAANRSVVRTPATTPAATPQTPTPQPSAPAVAETTPVVAVAAPAPATTPAPAPAASAGSKGWVWPAEGPLIARFNSNGSLNKGIDIAGNLGQPVKAAADGSVVYAGQGLLGYGEMLIIKHDDVYLSAYAHNSRLRVKEGDTVRAGQVVAEMGSTGTDRVKLHFEIRRRGQPVDPMGYLPRR
ncbi:peptidoglycan DD-metalloendopeptidase family protein [Halopseudomonas yangmingensis]|uniref:Lipoprotein NlpD n=1 Tax=Halopseudomonas yangmingensis TaxID=1720063 RepID=A0A1I4SAC7_9GAMM|nr:lipoprotein NlpD [Halopseudomonas yangmingensis]